MTVCPNRLGVGRAEGEKDTVGVEATLRSWHSHYGLRMSWNMSSFSCCFEAQLNSDNFLYNTQKTGNNISIEHLKYQCALILEPVVGV